ncbi:hypothetical protein D3C78_1198050 [compost metagenome]
MAYDFHPATVFKLLDQQTVHGDAADILDIAACHWLLVGNDRQGLQRRPGVTRGFFRMQAIEVDAHLRTALKTPSGCDLHQLHAAQRPVVLQFQEQVFDSVGPERIVEQRTQVSQGDRQGCAYQCSFQNPFGIDRIHGAATRDNAPRCWGSKGKAKNAFKWGQLASGRGAHAAHPGLTWAEL